MEQGSSKYVTGGPVDIPEDLNEREIAIKEWAEGNKHLEEALKKCIEHGLQTRASCAGHPGLGSDPYLGIDITDETRKTIYSILNNLFENRKCINSIDIFNDIDKLGEPRSHVAIHAKYKKRNELFDLITNGAQNEIELDKCHPIIQKMIEIEQRAKQLRLPFNALAYQNLGPAKAIVLINETLRSNRNIYNSAGIRHFINPCLTDKQMLKKLSSLCKVMGERLNKTKISKEKNSWELTKTSQNSQIINESKEKKEDFEQDR